MLGLLHPDLAALSSKSLCKEGTKPSRAHNKPLKQGRTGKQRFEQENELSVDRVPHISLFEIPPTILKLAQK